MKRAGWLLAALVAGYFALFTSNSLTRARSFSPDSMNYVDVARRLLAGDGLVQTTTGYNHPAFLAGPPSPVPFTAQAPAYSIVVAGLGLLGVEPADGALVWAALGALALVGWSALLGYRLGGGSGAAGAALLVLLCLPLRISGRCAWSDTLGAVLALAALDATLRRAFFRAGLLAGLAFATRYALVAVAPFAVVAAFCLARPRWAASAKVAAGWLAAALPMLLHNVITAGCALPRQNASTQSLGQVWSDFQYNLFGCWLGWGPDFVQGLLLLGLIALAAALARPLAPARAWLLWAGWYAAFIILQRVTTHFDDIGPRLLLPALIPLLALAGAALGRRLPAPVAAGALAVATLWLAGREVWVARRPPVLSVAERVSQVPRLAWIAQNVAAADVVIGDDAIDLPFYLGLRQVGSFSPHPYTAFGDYGPLLKLADAWSRAGAGRIWLVLRNRCPDEAAWQAQFGPFVADLAAQRTTAYPRLRPAATLPDAFVWEVTKL